MPYSYAAGLVAVPAIKEEPRRPHNGDAKRRGKEGQGIRPEGQVKEWLRGYGCDDEVLDAAGTERWLGVRRQEQAMERRVQLPGRFRGERVRRAQRDRNMTVGRQMYRGNYTCSTFHDEHGNEVVRDDDAEEMMWRNRESRWGTLFPTPQGADAILDEYFRERKAAIPNMPRIGERRIRGLVLACKGSAPGVDGIPYELPLGSLLCGGTAGARTLGSWQQRGGHQRNYRTVD